MPTKAYLTAETIGGLRESRINALKTLDFESYPFQALIGDDIATNPTHYYQIRTLPPANTDNAKLSGVASTYGTDSYVVTSGRTAQCQILETYVSVDFRSDAVDKAGIGRGKLSSFNDQKQLQMRQIKKDFEAILLSNQAAVAPLDDAGTIGNLEGARRLAAAGNGAEEIDASGNAYSGGGAAGQLTETMYQDLGQRIWRRGGTPGVCMVAEYGSRCISSFGYNTRRTQDVRDTKATFYVDDYKTAFGRQDIVLNPYLFIGSDANETLLMLDPQYWKIAYLQAPFFTTDGQAGDKTQGFWLIDATLTNIVPGASGRIFNIARASSI